MQTSADVVVIGAGVIGCSTAYHLARMGVTDVAVVEMGQVGSGSSGKSASMLSLQFCTDELTLRMAKHSYARYMAFEEEIGVPTDFRKMGWLSLATQETASQLLQSARLLQSMEVNTEILSPEEVKLRYPEIQTEDLVLGTWGPDDGPFDPHMIMWGYVKRAKAMGIRLYQGVGAIGMELRGGRVEGVCTEQGFIGARVVVNAAGPWAVDVGRWAGVEIPLANSARCIWVTRPFAELPSDRPFVEDLTAEWYYRPEGPCILMGMGRVPAEDLDIQLHQQLLGHMIEVATQRVPVLERAAIQTSWTGVRPLTPDGFPILGTVPEVEGLVLNCGWGGTGIIQAPVAGQLIAEQIHDGQARTIDIRLLGIERFRGR